VYDEALPSNLCEKLIKLFESWKHGQEYLNEDFKPCFTQINVNLHPKPYVKKILPYVRRVYDDYKKDTISYYLPKLSLLEEFRVKRYKTGGVERFDEHVDVASYDTARRCLAFLFYLNDSDGKTVFTRHGLSISPMCGRVVVFPPTWEYPHAGLAPSTKTKYIMSTYLHYG
tara:strand:+ start:231 stop:743 length:513 start_codon:yes stop_codon:yes gene_type:complete